MTNLDIILKSRDITLPTKVHLVKAMVFPVVMYGCENWTVKKDECQRIDAFEVWCWRRLLRIPQTVRRSKQSILKEISPRCSLEGLMLKLKFQYFGHLIQRVDALEKPLMLGGVGGRRRWGWQDEMAGWHQRLDGHEFEWTLGVGNGQGGLACCNSRGHHESDTTEWLNWTECKFPCDYNNQINFWTDRKIILLYVHLSLFPCVGVCVYLFTNNLHINCSSVAQSCQLKNMRLSCPSLSPRVSSN